MWEKEHFAEYSSRNIQIMSLSPKKNSSKSTLDKLLTVLTTCQNVCRSSKKSTLKVRKNLQRNLFRTIRLPQQIPSTRSKQFWFPCQKFLLGVWNSLWIFFRITLLLENVIMDTYNAILPPVLKNCHESSKYFSLHSRN